MAFVPRGNGSGFFLNVSVTDAQADVSNLEYELRSADYAAAVTDSNAILAALAAVTDSKVSAYSISYRAEENAFSFPADADNSIKARIIVTLGLTTEKATIDIPAPKDAVFVANSGEGNNIVNTAVGNGIVTDYWSLFKSTGEAFISDGEDAGTIQLGRRVARAKRFRS
jgi:hypothetical protein